MSIEHFVADVLEEISERILQKDLVVLKKFNQKTYGKVSDKAMGLIMKKADITLKRQIKYLRAGRRNFLAGVSDIDFTKKFLIPKKMSEREINKVLRGVEIFPAVVVKELFYALPENYINENIDNLIPIVTTLVSTVYEDLWLSTIACLKHEQEIGEQFFSDMMRLQEKERNRMAEVVNNEIKESMALMKSRIKKLSFHEKFAPEDVLTEIDNFKKMLLCGVRSVYYDLNENKNEEETFIHFLGHYLEDFEGRTGISVSFSTEKVFMEPNRNIWVHLFRILQEALNNIGNHSQATKVKVVFQATEEEILLEIHDDGVGFKQNKDAENTEDWMPPGQYGLVGMEQRAKMLGGLFYVFSNKEKGTKIVVQLPMRKGLPFHKKVKTEQPVLTVILDQSKKNNSIYYELESRHLFSSIYPINYESGDVLNRDKIIDRVVSLQPGVVIFDLDWNEDSLSLLKCMRKLIPFIIFLGVTSYSLKDIVSAMEAGIDGIVLANTSVDKFCDIIEAASYGYILSDPHAQKIIQKELSNLLQVQSIIKSDDIRNILTDRENEIIVLVERGHSNKEIAEQLYISLSTVKSTLAKIYEKLDCSNRAEAVAKLRQTFTTSQKNDTHKSKISYFEKHTK